MLNQSEKKIVKSGTNLSGVGSIFRAVERYIGVPNFSEWINGVSIYSEFQFTTLRELLWNTTEPAQAITNVKAALNFLQGEGFDYNFEEFTTFYVKYKEKEVDLLRTNEPLMLTDYVKNVELFHQTQPFFYDKGCLFWFWNHTNFRWEIVDEIDVMNAIDKKLNFYGQTITSTIKFSYLEAFRRVGRRKMPKTAPDTWVQFQDLIFDAKTKETFKATPEHFICNSVPYCVSGSSETPVLDNLFKEWVGEKYVKTLYEIIAYSCLPSYPLHLIFCLVGSGRNGKSCFQTVLTRFLGKTNVCTMDLERMNINRFETSKLYKKLVCQLGETNFGVMKNTSKLKQLSGGDLIDFEFKNKGGFSDYNYAKIIICSNSLPTSLDTSEGFYRRWIIIDFPNNFPEGGDILSTIPAMEYNNLCCKIMEILPSLLKRGMFTNQGTIEERKNNYIMASNPLPFFINEFCNKIPNSFVNSTDFYNAYIDYLRIKKKRKVSRKEFKSGLEEEGIYSRKTDKKIGERFVNGYYYEDICLKDDWKIHFTKNELIQKDLEKTPKIESESSTGNKTELKKVSEMSEMSVTEEKVTAVTAESALSAVSTLFSIESKEYKKSRESRSKEQKEQKADFGELVSVSVVTKKDTIFHINEFSNKEGLIAVEQLKEDLGVSDEFIKKMKEGGEIYEPRAGYVKVL